MLKEIDITKLQYYTTDGSWIQKTPPSYCIGIIDDDHVVQVSYDSISLIEIGNDPIPEAPPKYIPKSSGIIIMPSTIIGFLGGEEREIYDFSETIRYSLLPGISSSDTKYRIIKSLNVIGNMEDYRNFLVCRERDKKLSKLL